MMNMYMKFMNTFYCNFCRDIEYSSLYREHRYIEVLSNTFYCNVCRDIEYSSLYREHRYIEEGDIGVPLYNLYFATQLQQDGRKEGIDGEETSRKLRLIFTWASTRTVCSLRTQTYFRSSLLFTRKIREKRRPGYPVCPHSKSLGFHDLTFASLIGP